MSVLASEVLVGGGGNGGPTAAAPTLRGPPPPAPLPNNNHNKPNCCFCWCCCCSCSCLAVKGAEDNGPTKKEPSPGEVLVCDGEPPPTLDEIQGWGKSFDKLMRSAAGRKVFRDFLRCEYSEENIMFWLACEELKRERNADAVEEKARFIYEDYISILSPKEVSLDSRVREIVNRNMVEPTPHTFDEAQLQIYTLMHRDSYPRFVNSPLYKALAQVTSGTTTGGGSIKQQDSTNASDEPDSDSKHDQDSTSLVDKCNKNGGNGNSNDSKVSNDSKSGGPRPSPMRLQAENDKVSISAQSTTIISQYTGEASA